MEKRGVVVGAGAAMLLVVGGFVAVSTANAENAPEVVPAIVETPAPAATIEPMPEPTTEAVVPIPEPAPAAVVLDAEPAPVVEPDQRPTAEPGVAPPENSGAVVVPPGSVMPPPPAGTGYVPPEPADPVSP